MRSNGKITQLRILGRTESKQLDQRILLVVKRRRV
jgi:hypothetical protein